MKIYFTIRKSISIWEQVQPNHFKVISTKDLNTGSSDIKKAYPGYEVTGVEIL